jgi:CxxC motif-containing protein
VSHLRCPECRLTVPAAAYYLRGDQCPRCMTSMEPYTRPRPVASSPASLRSQPTPPSGVRAEPSQPGA